MIELAEDFEVVRSAVVAYLEEYPHWPAYHQLEKEDAAYARYSLLPDANESGHGNRLGFIVISLVGLGTRIEFWEPRVTEREQTLEERKQIRDALDRALSRYRPKNFDFENEKQRQALEQKLDQDNNYQVALEAVRSHIALEKQETVDHYAAQLEEVKYGLRSWLQARGIREVQEAQEPQESMLEDSAPGDRIAPKYGSKRYREWQERYSVVKPWIGRYSYETMLRNLDRRRDGLACSESTLRNTIKAGEAGELG